MSIADYWRASLALMRRELTKDLPAQCSPATAISEADFVSCADRSWTACRNLMAMCSDCTTTQIQDLFDHHGADFPDEFDEQGDQHGDEGRVFAEGESLSRVSRLGLSNSYMGQFCNSA